MRKKQLKSIYCSRERSRGNVRKEDKNEISGQHDEMVEHRGRENNTKSVYNRKMCGMTRSPIFRRSIMGPRRRSIEEVSLTMHGRFPTSKSEMGRSGEIAVDEMEFILGVGRSVTNYTKVYSPSA